MMIDASWVAYAVSVVRCPRAKESESVSYSSQTLALPGDFLVHGSVKIQRLCEGGKYTTWSGFGSGDYEGRSGG